ncbi:hypothetical protein [Luteipulveratus halotolerans]|uniref:Uncharacterized protein n=1 Tax=Luteipulveratus halotolerans TaxID=1631356 RepID=A0A0L6CKJ9_9MICO|nr:hypothetical protein [Luteipulveratus halotolerans]KNX38028.1 hypothetical protein VV01_14135 [Luteipulveratus halotolerans]
MTRQPTPAPLAGPPRPRPALLIGLAVLLALVAVILWQRSRQPAPPDRMVSTTVTDERPDGDRTRLTLRYRDGGSEHTATHEVSTAAYVAQGRTAWLCVDPDGETRVRLPMDPLC